MKNNVDKNNNLSIIITTLIITLTIVMGIIYGPEKEEIKQKERSVAANSGDERADIVKIASAEHGYAEKKGKEFLTKYNEWLWNYSRSDAGKAIGANKWNSSSIKTAPWCYIFIDWCAKQADCKLVADQKSKGFELETAISEAIKDDGWYKNNGRLITISSCNDLVSKGEVGDMVFSKGTGEYADYNHICVIGKKTETSVTLHEGDYLDSDGKFKVFTRVVKKDPGRIFGYNSLRSLGKPMYRATATFKTYGGKINSMPKGSHWSYVSQSGSGDNKKYIYKFFDDLENYNKTVTYLPDDISRTNYTFLGWKDEDGNSVKKTNAKQRGNVTYTAQWKANSCTITYYTNGGTIKSGKVDSYVPGEGATLPTDVVRDGFNFAGWFANKELTGDRVYKIGKDATGNKKYWAYWTPKSYNVTLDTKGGSIKSGNVTSYTYGEGAVLPTEVERIGHTFLGWHANSNYSDARVWSIGKDAMGDKTFYANWQVNSYAITYFTYGGTINSGKVTSYTYGIGATLPTNVTRLGYTFGGWYADSKFSGSSIGSIGTEAYGNKEYHAKWIPNVYKVTLNTNKGTIVSGNITSYTYAQGATLPTNVTRPGYDFNGWFVESNFSGSKITAIGKTEYGDKTYYAKWTPKVYSVTLHPNGGTIAKGAEVTQYTYTVGAKLPNAAQIFRSQCEFVGWFDNPELTGSPITKITPTDMENKEYWAKWNTFDVDTSKAVYYVYGLNNDKNVYRAEKVNVMVKTASTSQLSAFFSTTNSYTKKITEPVLINPNTKHVFAVPNAQAQIVARNRKDREIYLIVKVDCAQFDGDTTIKYSLYIPKKIVLRFSSAYNMR